MTKKPKDADIITKEVAQEEFNKIKREKILEMIMAQTNYSEEEALEQLKIWKYNTIYVIKAYLNPNFMKKKEEKKKTLNQRLIGEIRDFCDRGQKIYDMQQEMAQKKQKLMKNIISKENEKINEN